MCGISPSKRNEAAKQTHLSGLKMTDNHCFMVANRMLKNAKVLLGTWCKRPNTPLEIEWSHFKVASGEVLIGKFS